MTERRCRELLEARWERGLFVCVGLDAEPGRLPTHIVGRASSDALFEFNRAVVEATADCAAAYKPNSAFYEGEGEAGLAALRRTIAYIRERAPGVPVILDAKRADIGSTNAGYARSAFDLLGADAITVHPYLGAEALAPFLECEDKGVFVLCRTSNPGAGEFQDLDAGGEPLYLAVARRVASAWNGRGNCGLVAGATYPQELARVRRAAPELPILVPGVGAQGGDLEKAVEAARDARGKGFLINSSRGILYASSGPDFAEAAGREALRLSEAIRGCLGAAAEARAGKQSGKRRK